MISLDLNWLMQQEMCSLSNDEIHIWHVCLRQQAERYMELSSLLSVEEQLRGNRLYFPRDRKNFVLCRGLLRSLLSSYVNVEPERLQFQYNDSGKPEISPRYNREDIRFNVSHSNDVVLYVVARGRRVGIDIEYVRDMPDYGRIISHFFSEEDKVAFLRLKEKEYQEHFYNWWTLREAYIKAYGDGLATEHKALSLSFSSLESAEFISDGLGNLLPWSFWQLISVPGYSAALSAEGHEGRIRCWGYGTHISS